ncbi:hypothetical protein CLV56_4004 [Mumia flava]|uniref:Uncharacterized protein n=1 Tax=Mumia flava TaxID=1348852 RepID=A0A0B2BN91_9ACTN|nr:hypothetical protein [Mumia flava]PJJ48299.1 hypothetical protein CLV56_4004 [Mumia flava]
MAGIGTRLMKIEVDSADHTAEVSAVRVTTAESDSDFVTFADAASGGARDYKLTFTAVQDAATGTMWREVFDNAGDEVPVTLMPYGNATASATEPHYTMTAVIKEPEGDLIGGDADASTSARFTIECEWDLTGKPTEVTA